MSTIDADSATALVAGEFVNAIAQGDQEPVASPPAQFRVRVELVEVSGEWQVDAFDQVTGSGAAPSAPTQEPEPGEGSDGGEQ